MPFRVPPAARVFLWLAASCSLLGIAPATLAQSTVPDRPPTVLVPDETGAGVWDGTYVFSCRDFRIGLWIRSKNAIPEMKMRYQSLQSPETFETDWNGKATYYLSGQPATFEITYKSRDAKHIQASWHWEVESVSRGRVDDAEFTIFRSGYGRSAVFKFDKMEQQVRSQQTVRRFPTVPPPSWTFAKVSKRLDVLWEELPF